METNVIYNMDCLQGLKGLDSNCIDLTVTSPPYDDLRKYHTDGFQWNYDLFRPIADELYRVTKEGCVVVWVVGDACVKGSETGSSLKQALYFQQIGFNLHDTMIYQKASATHPAVENEKRYTQSWEYMFVFSKGTIRKDISLLADKRNRWAGCTTWNGEYACYNKTGDMVFERKSKPTAEFGFRTNIWKYNIAQNDRTGHPAVFPERLAEDHIRSWSVEGDLVMDPFMGSGTTAKMALLNGRQYLGFEQNPDYHKVSLERLAKYQGGSILLTADKATKVEDAELRGKERLWQKYSEEMEVMFNECSLATLKGLHFTFSNK